MEVTDRRRATAYLAATEPGALTDERISVTECAGVPPAPLARRPEWRS